MAIYNGTSAGERINGTSGGDTIYGNGGDDSLYGYGGNDVIYGGTGDDYLSGGDGNDILNGGRGVNDFRGGAGDDTFVMIARTTNSGFTDDLIHDMHDGDKIDVSAWGISDFSQVQAVMGVDYYGAAINAYYNGEDHLLSFLDADPSQFEATDFIYSNHGGGTQLGTMYADTLFGSRFDDVLRGSDGCDTLLGGIGNDALYGGGGGDDIFGGAGGDTLTGGGGYDAFIYQSAADSAAGAGHDVITDFRAGADWIDLCQVDANTGAAGDQAFHWIGTDDFTGAGQLRYETANGVTTVYGNTDGDSAPEFQIELTGAHTLHACDFVL